MSVIIPKKWLGAFKRGHRKIDQEFIDEDLSWVLFKRIIDSSYEDIEAIESLNYLTKFYNEYYKNVILQDGAALHNSKKLRSSLNSARAAKARDIMKPGKLGGRDRFLDLDINMAIKSSITAEDVIIELLEGVVPETNKNCPKCRQEKDIMDFYSGSSYCKSCISDMRKQQYKTKKELICPLINKILKT